nr:immunoglobulin light chain junction region [Macaca mulatta]MOX30546.1 immunoglobulin light chain junction region [Macaca mulatta]
DYYCQSYDSTFWVF